ncbi:hypothetical protein [Streptomyces microflavus]|uniref:hypothetical protein n=1 Tax=Streptomyces microflavus TaxID=1919 RepID=UPI002E381D83|nr:hypothetical protein [Streptomyces microflavus]
MHPHRARPWPPHATTPTATGRLPAPALGLGLASTGVLLSACAHVLATDAALLPAALTAGGVVAVGVMSPLTGRRPSVALGTAALALLQSVLHLPFAALTPSAQSAHSLAVPTEAVTRFSRIAFISVCVLAVTGLYQSWRWTKRLARPQADGGRAPLRALRRWVSAEAVVGLCVIAATTALAATQPARAPSAAVALSLTVRTSDFDQATVRESFEIP